MVLSSVHLWTSGWCYILWCMYCWSHDLQPIRNQLCDCFYKHTWVHFNSLKGIQYKWMPRCELLKVLNAGVATSWIHLYSSLLSSVPLFFFDLPPSPLHLLSLHLPFISSPSISPSISPSSPLPPSPLHLLSLHLPFVSPSIPPPSLSRT